MRHLIESESELMKSMFSYLMQLAYYDMSYDIRDRARFLKSLLQPSSEKVNPVILHCFLNQFPADLPIPRSSDSRRFFTLGSTSALTGEEGYGYVDMPNWAADVPSSSVRDSVQTIPLFNRTDVISRPTPDAAAKVTSQNTDTKINLQKFYESSQTSEEDDDDEDSDEQGDDTTSANDDEGAVTHIEQSPKIVAPQTQTEDTEEVDGSEKNALLSETDSVEETDNSEDSSSSEGGTVGLLASRFG